MKKILAFLLVCFASFAFIAASSVNAADEVIELYPYDSLECSLASAACLNTKVGSANWTVEYAGYRYHPVRGSVRYADDWIDGNSDSEIDINELTGISWTSFGALFINNTDETKVLAPTLNLLDRRDLTTGGRHDVYLHFDELGVLQMFEDSVNEYYVHNDGDMTTPDWRLATVAEKDAFDAATDPLVDTPNTIKAPIRIKIDAVDTDGYLLEPLKFVQMVYRFADTALDPESAWSTIIADNPVNVTIPTGWTVLTFAYLDRANNAKNLEYIKALPGILAAGGQDPMVLEYTDQPATFTGLTLLDDDGVTPGVNIVIDYNDDTFDLDPTISASWLDMFNDSDEIINTVEKLDYSVAISQDDVVLETINFTYNELTDDYTASAPVTVVDSSEFGAGYKATWSVTTPAGELTEAVADIVIGVMPPKFMGVADRFINEGTMIDLLGTITADDGYSNSKTDDIEISFPDGFNPYNPTPGEYDIDLTFTHHVHFDGVATNVDLNGTIVNINELTNLNADVNINTFGSMVVFTEITNFTDSTTSWGSVIVVVAADNTVKEVFDRYDWGHITSTGEVIEDLALFTAWQAALTLAPGEFIVAGHGSIVTPPLRALVFGDPVTFTLGYADFDYDIITDASYVLTVDDITAPLLLVVNHNYTIQMNEFTSINNAILSNVVAFDYNDDYEDLSMYVSGTGGMSLSTAGTYTVEVTVEDLAGNATIMSFPITVVASKVTAADVQALIDAQTLTAAEIQALIDALGAVDADDVQALIDAQTLTEAEIQALIDAAAPEETGCGSAISTSSVIFFVLSATAIASTVFIARKKKEISE